MHIQKLFLSLVFIGSQMACNSNTSSKQTADVKPPNDTAETVLHCYAYMQNGDTIRLQYTATGAAFTGNMLYQLSGKDRNDGTLQGTIKGDTLIGNYTFSSEGMQSVREVAFIKQNNGLTEGFGEVEESNGQMIFKNPHGVQFTGFVLLPTACN